MTKRIVTKIGDVFCIVVDNSYKRYFQYIANDINDLNSSTIRVFQKNYSLDSNPTLDEIVSDDIEFYTHTILRNGIVSGLWQKIGKCPNVGDVNSVMFRWPKGRSSLTNKYDEWYVWHINEDEKDIVKLTKEYEETTYIGGVYPPAWIVERIQYGKWTCTFPF
jgi:hypothetical protein